MATGDVKPFSRYLCRPARELNRPYVVLAHGYATNDALLSFSPLRADRLIFWTERQAELVRAVLL